MPSRLEAPAEELLLFFRARMEGLVLELHVLERILTRKIPQSLNL